MILVFVGTGVAAGLANETLRFYEKAGKTRAEQGKQATQAAKSSLLVYLLFRAENSFDIASGGSASVEPRLLMLPCPDNIGGDKMLDGTQDPPCGEDSTAKSNRVNDILGSGSRFGRLPWRTDSKIQNRKTGNQVKNAIYDGLGDFRDGHGNRLWYALALNMAPFRRGGLPLNFHRLATRQKGWLSVINNRGYTLSAKVAAVILAPEKVLKKSRQSEEELTAGRFRYPSDVSKSSALSPEKYFESYVVTAGVRKKKIANYNKNGVFIEAAPSRIFNDSLSFVDLPELMNPDGFFYSGYLKMVGVTDVHNAPFADRPLAKIHSALAAYRTLFGFYPTPAAATVVANLNTRQRYCTQYHSGAAQLTVRLPAGTPLLTPAAISLAGSTLAAATMTVSLTSTTPFLLAANAVVSPSLTLATYSRILLSAAGALVVTVSLPQLSARIWQLAAGEKVFLATAAAATVPAKTAITPPNNLAGWLPEHNKFYFARAGRKGSKFILPADTRGGFLSDAILTVGGVSITATAADVFTLAAGMTVRMEVEFKKLKKSPLSGTLYFANSSSAAVQNALPTNPTFQRRQFAVRLLTDVSSSSVTIHAPAVLFPWRQANTSSHKKQTYKGKTFTTADTRDNLHPYPPCFDSRNFADRNFDLFIEDQPIFYALADSCHYGATKSCGRNNGLMVSVAAQVAVALARPSVLTSSFFHHSGILVNNGIVRNTVDITLATNTEITILVRRKTAALVRFPANYVFSVGAAVVVPAGATVIGGHYSWLDNVEALLIYSPAPLARVSCVRKMALIKPLKLSITSQQTNSNDITPFCYWLDDPENADGDTVYVIRPAKHQGVALRNDYFLFFGGRLRL